MALVENEEVNELVLNEVRSWVDDGIITEEQASRISERLRCKGKSSTLTSSRFITILSVMGALLLGLGVILFFAANWQAIPKFVKVLMILSLIAATYLIGYYLKYVKKDYPMVGSALIFLGCLLYGAGIWLIAQMYNMNAHYPNSILLWVAGILPMAYLGSSSAILVLSLLLMSFWVTSEVTFLTYATRYSYLSLIMLYGAVLLAIGNRHRLGRYSFFSGYYAVLGMILIHVSAFPLTFSFTHAGSAFEPVPETLALIEILVMVLAAGLTFPYEAIKSRNIDVSFTDVIGVVLICLLAISVTAAPSLFSNYIISNTLYFLLLVGSVYMGVTKQSSGIINIGVVFFCLDVIARYFGLFWELLPTSLFFLCGGALVLGGGIALERKRRGILRALKK